MSDSFTIGDVIRKARKKRRWSQTRLGQEATRYAIRAGQGVINKSTVSKVEIDPYSSEFGTVWRLAVAIGLSLGELERKAGLPFLSSDLAEYGRLAKDAEREILATERTTTRMRKPDRKG